MNMFEINSKIAVIMILPRMANEVCQAFPSHACCARDWNVNASSQLSRHLSIRPESDSNWSRCVLLDQILTLQVRPELSRNLSLHRGVVFQDLMFSADTDH